MTAFSIDVDGQDVPASTGDTIAVAILRAGVAMGGPTSGRGLFCGMGSCYECHAVVDGVPLTRTCLTPARPGTSVVLLGTAGA